jgi:hypothetical protein
MSIKSIGLITICIAACGTDLPSEKRSALSDPDLPQQGAFTCDLVIGPELTPQQAPSAIERDRMLMSHPGMRQKMLPILFGPNNTLLMGGRYLFDTEDQAEDYEDFVLHRYVLEGVQFIDRVYFKDHDCRHWKTIGAHDFADFRSAQVVMRTERWSVPNTNWVQLLKGRWPAVRDAAGAQGLTSVWLLYSQRDNFVELVYYADRVQPNDPNVPDFASLGALAGAPALGGVFADQTSWSQDLDRTHWVFTIWQPFVLGDRGAPSIFPYSPPFPGLVCGDGLCAPSHGESNATCPADCPLNCGDGVCPDQGEDVHNCPSDCRVPSSPIQ